MHKNEREKSEFAKKPDLFDYEGNAHVGGKWCENEYFRDFVKKEEAKSVEIELEYEQFNSTFVAVE